MSNVIPHSSQENLVVHLIVVGFHHKKGHQIEYSYPSIVDPIDQRWSNVCSLALPDGAHQRNEDLIYFHLPSLNDDETLFCVSSYRQIDANVVKNKESDITRNSVQKSVCLILRRPLFGIIGEQLKTITEIYFHGKDFSQREILNEFVNDLNRRTFEFDLNSYSIRDLVQHFGRKSLLLFKLILLEKKILFMLSPIEFLVKTLLTLLSLIPDVIENGLSRCIVIGEQETNVPIDKDEENGALNFFQRTNSLKMKLSQTFTRLTSVNENPDKVEDSSSSFDELSISYSLFRKNKLFHPYLSIDYLDAITNRNVKSFIIGASNQLFVQLNDVDFILNENQTFLVQSQQLKDDLQLTTADLRFVQLFYDEMNQLKSEQELRHLFRIYFISLLSVALNPNVDGSNDFNSSFVRSFQSTESFRLWKTNSITSQIEKIPARHPLNGQINVNDIRLRVAHVLDDTETGRKLKGAFQETSSFVGDKSRSAGQVLGQAKNSLLTSFVTTFNQGKQWLNNNQ